MFRSQSGQVGIWNIVAVGASIVIAFGGSLLAQNNLFASKVDIIRSDISGSTERIARLEEAINTIKIDNVAVKQDLREILKLLK